MLLPPARRGEARPRLPILFVSQALMHYSALRTLRVLEREWRCAGHVLAPGMPDFFSPFMGSLSPLPSGKKREQSIPAGFSHGAASPRVLVGMQRGESEERSALKTAWGCCGVVLGPFVWPQSASSMGWGWGQGLGWDGVRDGDGDKNAFGDGTGMGMGRKERGSCAPKPPIGSSQKQFVGWIPPHHPRGGQPGAFVSSPHANEEPKPGTAPHWEHSGWIWGASGFQPSP